MSREIKGGTGPRPRYIPDVPITRFVLVSFLAVACSAKPANRDSELPRDTKVTREGDPAAAVPPPDKRELALSELTVGLVERQHLLRKTVDDQLSRDAFVTYLERLDGGKVYLLASDRDALAKHAAEIDDELQSKSMALAHEGAKIYVTRVAVVEEMVAKILAAPMNHDDEEWVELDPKKLDYAATDDELRDRWRQRLELEVMERVGSMEARLETLSKDKDKEKEKGSAAGAGSGSAEAAPPDPVPATREERELKARTDLAKTYAARFVRLKNPAPLDAASDLINAVVSTLDPHSTYLPPADKANFDIQITGQVEGIGATLREHDDLIEVVDLVPGGAAWRQGDLSAGDLILWVQQTGQDPVDVFDMRIDDVVKMIRGPKGSVVKLRVQKGSGEQKTISITRDKVAIESAYARGAVLTQPKGKTHYGYIFLPSFYGGDDAGQRTAAKDVHRLLVEMKKKKVDGVILDLRSNGGGILGDAVELTGELIDEGPVVQVRDGGGKRAVLEDEEGGTDYDGTVVVMIDRFSASASEIVAGALQDYKRAIVVGTTTHGKGTVQTVYDLDAATGGDLTLGVMKLTVQQFFRVTGSSTQVQGVSPDIPLPDSAGYVDSREDTLEHALPWSKIDPADFRPLSPKYNVADLAKKSAARVAKEPMFTAIDKAVAALKARRDDTREPLQRAAWDAERKQTREDLAALDVDLDKTRARLTVNPIADPDAKPIEPGPNGRTDDRATRWRENLARDPWVEEAVNILHDASAAK
jgi:carboxyl-terminal processing protease